MITAKKYILVLFIAVLITPRISAQKTRDTVRLPEFEIKAGYIQDNMGFKRIRLDSVMITPLRSSDLSTLLSEHSTIFIKSYGNNNLSTPSFRGTAAHHTQVEWNGININSPMLGQTDLSLIPVSQFDEVEILYGAAGISRSSGAFGGIVNLVTTPDWTNNFNITLCQMFGSFENFITNFNGVVGNSRIQSHTRINFSTIQNDFPYTNTSGVVVRQQNASGKQAGFAEEVFFRINDRNLLSAKIWYTESDRNLPAVVSNPDSGHREKMYNKALRSLIEYKLVRPVWNLMVRSALVDDFMHYSNDSMNINARHQYYSSVNRVRFGYVGVKKLILRPGIDLTYDWVNSDGYSGQKTRNTVGFFGEILYTPWKKLNLSLVLREDLVDGKIMPFIPAFGAEYRPFNNIELAITLNLARNYRYPTLNDLYWVDFGNPDLNPEIGYTSELGFIYHLLTKNNRFFLESELTGYYSMIQDYIEWSQVSGSVVFRPGNITEVLSRGVEAGLRMKAQLSRLTLSLDNNYHYCRSTYQKTKSPNDKSLGKQLKYVPVHTLNSTLGAEFYNFYLQYNFNWTSRRYNSNDNYTYMPGYNLSNVFFGKKFILKSFILSLQLQINNLFNLDYQSITNYAMPGRNYAGTLIINYSSGNR